MTIETPGHEKQQDPKTTIEQKKKFKKLHENNAEFGTEIEESESLETQNLKKEGRIEKVAGKAYELNILYTIRKIFRSLPGAIVAKRRHESELQK